MVEEGGLAIDGGEGEAGEGELAEVEKEIAGEKLAFDDRVVAREALRA